MGLMFLEAKIEKKEIYSMETIVQIILAPWTFFQWIFSIVVWYYVLRLLFSQAEGIGWERFAVKTYLHQAWNWIDEAWDALKSRTFWK